MAFYWPGRGMYRNMVLSDFFEKNMDQNEQIRVFFPLIKFN